MTTVFLPVGSLLYFDTGTDPVTPTWTKLTEHNRQPASIQINRIEKNTHRGRKVFDVESTKSFFYQEIICYSIWSTSLLVLSSL